MLIRVYNCLSFNKHKKKGQQINVDLYNISVLNYSHSIVAGGLELMS